MVRKLGVIAANAAMSAGFVAVGWIALVTSVARSSLEWNQDGRVSAFLMLAALFMFVLAAAHVPLCVTRHRPTLGTRLLRQTGHDGAATAPAERAAVPQM